MIRKDGLVVVGLCKERPRINGIPRVEVFGVMERKPGPPEISRLYSVRHDEACGNRVKSVDPIVNGAQLALPLSYHRAGRGMRGGESAVEKRDRPGQKPFEKRNIHCEGRAAHRTGVF